MADRGAGKEPNRVLTDSPRSRKAKSHRSEILYISIVNLGTQPSRCNADRPCRLHCDEATALLAINDFGKEIDGQHQPTGSNLKYRLALKVWVPITTAGFIGKGDLKDYFRDCDLIARRRSRSDPSNDW